MPPARTAMTRRALAGSWTLLDTAIRFGFLSRVIEGSFGLVRRHSWLGLRDRPECHRAEARSTGANPADCEQTILLIRSEAEQILRTGSHPPGSGGLRVTPSFHRMRVNRLSREAAGEFGVADAYPRHVGCKKVGESRQVLHLRHAMRSGM